MAGEALTSPHLQTCTVECFKELMRCFFMARLARPSLEKHNILAQSTTLLFQKYPMMIVLNWLDKALSHEGDSILEFRGNSMKEKTLIATLRVCIEKCSFFSFNRLSVSMEITATEEILT